MTQPMAARQHTIREVLAIPEYRRLWIAQFVSIFGDFVALYAVYSMVSFRLHASAREVSLITVFFLLPLAFVGPVAGVFVDRWDARRTMVASDLIRAGLALLLIFASSPYHVYAVVFGLSVVSSFFLPAQSVTTPLLVPREALMSASALMQQTMQVVRLISPVLAGAMVSTMGERSCYYFDSATFVFSASMIGSIAITADRPHLGRQLGSAVSELLSGMKFVVGHPVVGFVILSIAAGTFAIACFSALISVYVRDILHSGAWLFGALGSIIGGGMLAGGALITTVARKYSRSAHLVAYGIVGVGISIAFIALLGTRLAAMIGCAGIGLASSLIIIPAGALMQSETPADMRGRVSSSSVSLIAVSQGISILFAGDLAARFGIVPVYHGSAVVLLIVGLIGFLRLRRIG
jgi:MFS family permease